MILLYVRGDVGCEPGPRARAPAKSYSHVGNLWAYKNM